ncbi:protein cereblon-like [Antedon mediterranea]|uniref:protein cereblon-like n=1 Tax=Antedon mediterranea TaxID=105859 RepID=UPI003AF90968
MDEVHDEGFDSSSDSEPEAQENIEMNINDWRINIRGVEDHEKVKKRPAKFNFDPSLPTAHSYLGNDLEEYSGRTIHDDESYVTLPLMPLNNVVLIPGQTIPLQLLDPRKISMMRHVLQKDRTFGVVSVGQDFEQGVASVGTTAEIYSVKENDENGLENMKIKAMGRQRFKIMDISRQTDGNMVAKVQILPDKEILDPLHGARMNSYYKQRALLPHKQTIFDSRRRKNKLFESQFTWWPPWVYQMYDSEYLMALIKEELRSWYEGSITFSTIPERPSDFSFWVASNIPINDSQRLLLLKVNSPIQRMRCELDLLKKCTLLCCKRCGHQIANKSDVFCMSLDGPMAAYVNPGGYIHETLTLYRAQNLNLIGRPSKENSWFPGYAWTIIQCRHCSSHMGWKFSATKRKLKPDKFWGLTRSALMPSMSKEGGETTSWQPIL